jgi:hypothetical protein
MVLSRSWRNAATATDRGCGRAARLGSLALAAALVGCAAYRDADLRPPTVEPGQASATLVVDRPGRLAWGRRDTVLIDGIPAASLKAGGSGTLPVPAGLHVVGLTCRSPRLSGSSDAMQLWFEAGVTYHLRASGSIVHPCQLGMPPAALFPSR